jgi:hypothetical protein
MDVEEKREKLARDMRGMLLRLGRSRAWLTTPQAYALAETARDVADCLDRGAQCSTAAPDQSVVLATALADLSERIARIEHALMRPRVRRRLVAAGHDGDGRQLFRVEG